MDFFRANSFVVGALTGSLASYLLGLLVTHFKRPKRWLGYRVSSRAIVQRGHPHLTLKFDGREIASLASHIVLLQNVGNQPLKSQTVFLVVGDGGEVLETDWLGPEGAEVKINRLKSTTVSAECDLLNPGEYFSVGLTVANAPGTDVHVAARGEMLEVKVIGLGLGVDSDILLEAILSPLPFGGLLTQIARSMRRRSFLERVT